MSRDVTFVRESAGVWTNLDAAGQVPQARSYHVAATAGGAFYAFGGCGAGSRLNELHRYDPATNAWKHLPSSDAVLVPAKIMY